MLSEQKTLLRVAEFVALAAIGVAVYFGVQTHREHDPDFPVMLAGVAGMGLLMVTFLPACMLGSEYVTTVRKPSTWRQHTAGFDRKELTAVLRWAPRFQLVIAALSVLVLVFAAFKYGSVQFNSNTPPDPSEIPSLFYYFAVFYALALPVLGSAARMPGTYADHGDA
jgi:nitric oxide reductase large subunit